MNKKRTLADLRVGEKAVIESFTEESLGNQLCEMGCLPGEEVVLERKAPMGDPIAIKVSGYILSIRKSDAARIVIQSI